MNMPGWIALNRSLTSWEWYDDANTMRLFVHFLLKANYEPKKWKGISIDRGEFVTSNETLAIELKLSIQQVRTSLKKLKSTNEVTCKTTKKMSLISITNYKKFQDINSETNTHSDSEITPAATSNQHLDNSEITPEATPNQHRNNSEITPEATSNQHRDNNNITNKQINNKQIINTSCGDSENSAPKKTPKITTKPAALDFSSWPEKPSPEIWAQYKKIRQAKRAPVTQVLVDAMGKEFAKLDPVDWSVEKALRIAIAKGWQGFEAQWLVNTLSYRERPAVGRFPRDGPVLTRDMSLEDELNDRSWVSS